MNHGRIIVAEDIHGCSLTLASLIPNPTTNRPGQVIHPS